MSSLALLRFDRRSVPRTTTSSPTCKRATAAASERGGSHHSLWRRRNPRSVNHLHAEASSPPSPKSLAISPRVVPDSLPQGRLRSPRARQAEQLPLPLAASRFLG